ncbi:GNAT family N-acetyltransferase [Ornithinibacillus scapharcae]|uniref:GNAT family N-acetyltransferase n=1 Tax=Ornithinibacillus scapharcae TaxID=1147159 RepID=UPI000225BAB6|nr:GNAT family protein [Ornithinibacillus scapharcae]
MENRDKVFPVLTTERLCLREIENTDVTNMLTYLSDPLVMQYYGLEAFTTEEEVLNEISWYKRIFRENTGIRWGISLKDEDKIIGSCGFLNWERQHARIDIGYELAKEYWGQGIASEVLGTVLSYGFEQMNVERVQALIEPPNVASIKLVEKQGFEREGLLRHYEYGNGKFDDLYMYSLLKGDFITK